MSSRRRSPSRLSFSVMVPSRRLRPRRSFPAISCRSKRVPLSPLMAASLRRVPSFRSISLPSLASPWLSTSTTATSATLPRLSSVVRPSSSSRPRVTTPSSAVPPPSSTLLAPVRVTSPRCSTASAPSCSSSSF
ncbi:hypothetical protein VTJ49DRAFT_5678 [Mycothermus thermophilus]|uniref:Uncharacterized protein n=1 Tax=Humicola insolens TaxID=85995 RepID=A0ABR3V2R4_HUMIN